MHLFCRHAVKDGYQGTLLDPYLACACHFLTFPFANCYCFMCLFGDRDDRWCQGRPYAEAMSMGLPVCIPQNSVFGFLFFSFLFFKSNITLVPIIIIINPGIGAGHKLVRPHSLHERSKCVLDWSWDLEDHPFWSLERPSMYVFLKICTTLCFLNYKCSLFFGWVAGAEPSMDSLRQQMRRVVADRKEAARVGQQARADIVSHWSPQVVAEMAYRRLLHINTVLLPSSSSSSS